jgi:hypothetical protein
MKNLISIYVVFFLFQFGISNAQYQYTGKKQEINVPIIVQEEFNKKFPGKDPVWFRRFQGEDNQKLVYEGKFIFDNRYSAAIYDNEGVLLAFTSVVEIKELPQKVQDYMKEKYPNFPIIEALLVNYSSNNEVTFELGVYIDNVYIIKVFSKDGDFIKSTRA